MHLLRTINHFSAITNAQKIVAMLMCFAQKIPQTLCSASTNTGKTFSILVRPRHKHIQRHPHRVFISMQKYS
ncbi:hypothetical protein NSE_0716 [Neorickettsia sennetsu str. Miyayama]|uniref:Uncharacterized protein n=1 Tax=Ehrlichia sennetsu (strain ATCC VR-367 / Miyayama) TaxID=222891 RepID=Q2GD54_EHRS3|nr:hypothetical protein NSE_0716 [Neorickettsia sennetsu str. Miyayama]